MLLTSLLYHLPVSFVTDAFLYKVLDFATSLRSVSSLFTRYQSNDLRSHVSHSPIPISPVPLSHEVYNLITFDFW